MRAILTTLLDALALLLIAGGVGGGLYQWIGLWSLVVSGLIILGGSALAAHEKRGAK
jgi:hypothetical protein